MLPIRNQPIIRKIRISFWRHINSSSKLKLPILIFLLLCASLLVLFSFSKKIALNSVILRSLSDYRTSYYEHENLVVNILLRNQTLEQANQEYMDEMIEKFNHTHAFITSAYYYEKSKSLGNNALAMVVVMNQRTTNNIEDYKLKIVSTSYWGEVLYSDATVKKESTETSCAYVMTLVQSQTVHNPEKIEIVSSGTRVAVPFRQPRTYAHSPVVICIAPQFAVEKWQLFLMNIHVARRYGGHMHIYVTSMMNYLFNLLKIYESWGSVTVDYWLRMKFNETFTPYSEPNKNVEWRNQAGAQTDCLLQYKEVAEFVAFFDIDDILIPRFTHNYHQEFTSHFSAFPEYHSIFYMKRDMTVEKLENARDLSFVQLFSSMNVRKNTDYGKSIVNPLKVNSTWIHHSVQIPRNRIYRVPDTELVHIKSFVERNPLFSNTTNVPRMYGTQFDHVVSETDVKALDIDLQQCWLDKDFATAASLVVDKDFYADIVFQCYNQSFYHPYFTLKTPLDEMCPNADDCFLPQREDIKCIHSDAKYISGPEMFPITFHYAVNQFWSKDIGCYQ